MDKVSAERLRELREMFSAEHPFLTETARRSFSHETAQALDELLALRSQQESPSEDDDGWSDPCGQAMKPHAERMLRELIDSATPEEVDALRSALERAVEKIIELEGTRAFDFDFAAHVKRRCDLDSLLAYFEAQPGAVGSEHWQGVVKRAIARLSLDEQGRRDAERYRAVRHFADWDADAYDENADKLVSKFAAIRGQK